MKIILIVALFLFSLGCKEKHQPTRHWFVSYHGHTLSDHEAWGDVVISNDVLPSPKEIFAKCVLESGNLDSARMTITQILELLDNDYLSFTKGLPICNQ